LTRDLTELKRRRMSAPSQPNLTYLSRDSTAPSPAPSIRSESLVSVASNENEICQQLQQPPSSTLPYIPDSVLKSLHPSSAATLPSSATQNPERSFSSAFSTASLGRRRKKSFNALRGGSGSDLAAQRAELDERVAFLEHELTRYKTYSSLLEAELTRLQRLPPQTPASPQAPYGTPGPVRGFWQVCGPSADLQEEPSEGCIGGGASPIVSSLPPPPSSKRGYSPSGMRQTRSQRMQYRQYQMQQRRQQQQQFYPPTPILGASGLSSSNPPVPNVQKTQTEEETLPSYPLIEENKKPETIPTAFYEVI
uniref:BZIP domain-containing protein n=1 Tax=Rodentolepis nana TaxID=102285 RepID=A0A0R3TWB2_RODNA